MGSWGFARYGVASWNWVIRALTVPKLESQISNQPASAASRQVGARAALATTNGLAATKTCLIIDVISQHARRRTILAAFLFVNHAGFLCNLYPADVFALVTPVIYIQGCSVCGTKASKPTAQHPWPDTRAPAL